MHLLATALEAAPFTLPGDVPALAPGAPHWLQVALTVVPLVVTAASFIAQFLNGYIRAARAKGEPVPTVLLALGAALNVAALNGDKAVEQAKAATTPRCPKCGKELQAALTGVGFDLACPSCFQNGNNSEVQA